MSGPAGAILATSRGIGAAAVRTPRQRAFAGAGTHRQAELVRPMPARRMPSVGS